MTGITSKELTALEDQLTSEQSLVTKFKMYAQTATDTEIKEKCTCIANKHQKHYDTLVTALKG